MEQISDEKLDWLIHDCGYNGIETEVNAAGSDDDRDYDCDDLIAALQELKERRVEDNKMVENIKKEMVIFCKNFEDRRNHSTICHPPDDNECAMLNFCESIENILEAGATRKENLPVEQLGIKAQLRLVRDKCPDMWKLILAENCPDSWGLERTVKILCEQCYPDCKECWDKALEGE